MRTPGRGSQSSIVRLKGNSIRVSKLAAAQIDGAVELLSRAFHDQPYGQFYARIRTNG